jgi:signal peptidase I
MKKVGAIVGWVLLAVLLFLAYGTLNNRWYRVVAVEGGSMSPTLKFGDLIVVTPPTENIQKGTIVVMSVNNELVTHRLIAGYVGGTPETKGDANNAVDNFSGSNLRIVGIVRLRIPWAGYPLLYLRYVFSKI